MRVLLIDNYDSFTYNLKQVFVENKCEVDVVRNDVLNFDEMDSYDALVFSPGPGLPGSAGDLKKVVETYLDKKPMLGICLGMQAIAEVLGSELELMSSPLHGCGTKVEHFGHPIFNNIPSVFSVGRYHSWVVKPAEDQKKFEVISKDMRGLFMGIKHREYPVFGLQFHPESILTKDGSQIIANFLNEVNS